MPDLPTQIDELGSVVDGVDVIDDDHINDLRRYIELLSIARGWFPPGSGNYTIGAKGPASHSTSATFTANRLHGVPVVLPQRATYSGLAICIGNTIGGSPNARLGIYQDSGGLPGALLAAGASSFAPDTAGLYDVAFSESQVIGPGVFWLALLFDSAAGAVQWNRSLGHGHYQLKVTLGGTKPYGQIPVYRTFSYAALPDPFGSISGTSTASPRIALKEA